MTREKDYEKYGIELIPVMVNGKRRLKVGRCRGKLEMKLRYVSDADAIDVTGDDGRVVRLVWDKDGNLREA